MEIKDAFARGWRPSPVKEPDREKLWEPVAHTSHGDTLWQGGKKKPNPTYHVGHTCHILCCNTSRKTRVGRRSSCKECTLTILSRKLNIACTSTYLALCSAATFITPVVCSLFASSLLLFLFLVRCAVHFTAKLSFKSFAFSLCPIHLSSDSSLARYKILIHSATCIIYEKKNQYRIILHLTVPFHLHFFAC